MPGDTPRMANIVSLERPSGAYSVLLRSPVHILNPELVKIFQQTLAHDYKGRFAGIRVVGNEGHYPFARFGNTVFSHTKKTHI